MFPDITRDDVFRLETRRLWLRWPRQADAPAVIRLAGNKAVAAPTASIPHPYPPEAAEPFILRSRRENLEGDGLHLAIAEKARPTHLIGLIGIVRGADDRAELGYWLGEPHWGQGYATEAAQAMVDAFFTLTGEREITAATRVINPASRRVLEKCGFAYQGSGLREFPARGGRFPVDFFGLDRRAFESIKGWGRTGYHAAIPEPALAAE